MEKLQITTDILAFLDKDTDNLPKEVVAAISLNPTLRWIKFILTDDKPNANRQRIPQSEFANLVKTGLHMPIKMAQGFIREGHEFSVPIGAITSLNIKEALVEGIAALWGKEFPSEVDLLKDMHTTGEKPQLSWEILYVNSDIDDETGVETFQDVALSAATIVGMPAYEGRTPIVSMAAKEAYRIKQEAIDEMEEKIKELEDLVKTMESEKAELQISFDALKEELEALKIEHAELTTFKEEVEAAEARVERVKALTELFSNTGVPLPEDFFEDEEKAEKLLSMDLDQLTFVVQDLALFSKDETIEEIEEASEEDDPETEEAGKKHLGSKNKIPNVSSEDVDDEDWTPSRIAKKLKEDRKKS